MNRSGWWPPGGTGSICHAMLAYRDHAAATRGIVRPNVIKPETAHPAFDKACHLFGIELRVAPVDPQTTEVDTGWVEPAHRRRHGRPRRIRLQLRLRHHRPDRGASPTSPSTGASDSTWTAASAVDPPLRPGAGLRHSRLRLPAPGGDLHLGRHPQVRVRAEGHLGPDLPGQGGAQRAVLLHHRLERRQVLLAGHGRLTFRWPARRHLGVDGPARPRGLPCAMPRRSSRPPRPCRRRCAPTPNCGSSGIPTFLFSFTSDEFDIYHVNDFMRGRGWRFNGQQYPNALHMAVTRPQTQARWSEAFATDLDEAVAYAAEHADETPGVGCRLRGRGRRDDRRGRRVHPDGDGRDDGRPAGHSGRRLTVPDA